MTLSIYPRRRTDLWRGQGVGCPDPRLHAERGGLLDGRVEHVRGAGGGRGLGRRDGKGPGQLVGRRRRRRGGGSLGLVQRHVGGVAEVLAGLHVARLAVAVLVRVDLLLLLRGVVVVGGVVVGACPRGPALLAVPLLPPRPVLVVGVVLQK